MLCNGAYYVHIILSLELAAVLVKSSLKTINYEFLHYIFRPVR